MDYTLENFADHKFKFYDQDKAVTFTRDHFIPALNKAIKSDENNEFYKLTIRYPQALKGITSLYEDDIQQHGSKDLIETANNRSEYESSWKFNEFFWSNHRDELRIIAAKKHPIATEIVQMMIDGVDYDQNNVRVAHAISRMFAHITCDGARRINRDVLDYVFAQEKYKDSPVQKMHFLMMSNEIANSLYDFSLSVLRGEKHQMHDLLHDYVMKPYGLDYDVASGHYGYHNDATSIYEYLLFNPNGKYGLPQISFFVGSDLSGAAEYGASYREKVVLPKIGNPQDFNSSLQDYKYRLEKVLGKETLRSETKQFIQTMLTQNNPSRKLRPSAMGS